MGSVGNKMLGPVPERRAILDVDNFIQQQKKDGVTARSIIIGLSESIDSWLLVKYLLVGSHVVDKFGDNTVPPEDKKD